MDDRNLTEAQARALWERAARLHAESAARQLGAGVPSDDDELSGGSESGEYSVDVVVRSAVEAGIPEEFIQQAMTELGRDAADHGRVDRWAERWTGDDTPALVVRRVLAAPVEEVYGAMQRVYPNPPYGLTLSGTDGRPPTEGGRLTFEVPYSLTGLGGPGANQAVTDLRHWADVKEIDVRLRPVAGDPSRTEIEILAHLGNTRRVNFWAGNGVGTLLGAVGGLLTGAITSSIIDPVTAAQLFATFGAAGTAAVGTFSTTRWWWRPFYRLALRRGRRGMERLIDAVLVDMQTGGAFTKRVEPPRKGEGVDDLLGSLGL